MFEPGDPVLVRKEALISALAEDLSIVAYWTRALDGPETVIPIDEFERNQALEHGISISDMAKVGEIVILNMLAKDGVFEGG